MPVTTRRFRDMRNVKDRCSIEAARLQADNDRLRSVIEDQAVQLDEIRRILDRWQNPTHRPQGEYSDALNEIDATFEVPEWNPLRWRPNDEPDPDFWCLCTDPDELQKDCLLPSAAQPCRWTITCRYLDQCSEGIPPHLVAAELYEELAWHTTQCPIPKAEHSIYRTR